MVSGFFWSFLPSPFPRNVRFLPSNMGHFRPPSPPLKADIINGRSLGQKSSVCGLEKAVMSGSQYTILQKSVIFEFPDVLFIIR